MQQLLASQYLLYKIKVSLHCTVKRRLSEYRLTRKSMIGNNYFNNKYNY